VGRGGDAGQENERQAGGKQATHVEDLLTDAGRDAGCAPDETLSLNYESDAYKRFRRLGLLGA
jgi:hypothetical protein